MPKLYEYLGIVLFFYSSEHDPVHIHGKHNGKESKAEIYLFDGKVKKIIIKDKGQGLEPAKRKEFEEFVSVYAEEIVEKWIDFFIRKKPVKSKIITQRIKNVRTMR